ncbi:iron(III) transport system substrate-binding protein [Catalinimonas alkaloidigena]|uniref:ABC transporter substrate-binding protein n=1 Tax=Catalinimonas alkaloidigena TaxID=1075417 RepID=UPI00240624AF|nr:extracellular solute-binding protein [Catalinimonas alkaloidigena]MDF9800709.1 iron(III) transport system substrate-binding protein [Catalinimonas alkaloidigena]
MAKLYWILFFLLSGILACDSPTPRVQQGEVVTIFSNALNATDRQLFTAFERSSGVKVNIIIDTGEQIIERLAQQQQDSVIADLILLEGITYFQKAKQVGLLDTLSQGSIVNAIPEHLRDRNLQWIGLGYSANAIAYLRDSVDTLQVRSYADLSNPEWRGKTGWGTQNKNIYLSQLASMLADQGAEAEQWISGLSANLLDSAHYRSPAHFSVTDSTAWLALTNTADYIKNLSEGKRFQSAGLLFSPPAIYLHLTGVGILDEAPHPAQARALLNYLFSRDIVTQYTRLHFLYPTRPDIDPPPSLRNLGLVNADSSSQSNIARYTEEAENLFNRYGW